MDRKTRLLCDFNDKIACRDEILFEISVSIDYIRLQERYIAATNTTRKSYIEHVYKSDKSETREELAEKKVNMQNDLRLQYIAERFDYLKENLEDNKALLEDQHIRLLRINKLIDLRIKQYPFLKEYDK